MKIIITESQYVNLFTKRRIKFITYLVDLYKIYYHPCDYDYIGGFDDYYDDVVSGVVRGLIDEDLKIEWDRAVNMIDDFTEMVTADINGLFKDDLKIFFRKKIKRGCKGR
jgi:hypothetical protein